jgi:Macrocin-O-methyltransferase (TylF)
MFREAIRYLGPVRPLAKRSTRLLFPHYSWLVDRLNWEAKLRATVKQFPSAVEPECREDLHRYVSETILKGPNTAIDYLEFGVYEGDSIRQWCSLNQNAASRLFGFDSFEGLPEDWHSGKRKGAFSTGGKTPEIADSRVSFIAGWFQKSLHGFLDTYHPQSQLVIHMDCDLFSSTLYCLTALDRVISPGTLIVFDDFFDALHVYRALSDYCSAYLRQYQLLARTHELGQVAIVML